MRKIIFLFLIGYGFGLSAQAPMLSNQGALISVKDNAFVSVRGDVQNDNDGTFDNSNAIYVYGDWENNANNEAFTSIGEGVVSMRGGNQRIKGSSITRFYELRLEYTGTKYADLDVYVDGLLQLTDREFNIDTNTVHVFNPDLNAVVHMRLFGGWGFVSALGDGGLLRHTNNTSNYLYPVGSALGTVRFRPINISPSTTAAAAFKVRMANVDATNEGWDRSLSTINVCEINPGFYHRISRTAGSQDASLEFFFDAALDGAYAGIGNWMTGNLWDAVSPTTAGTNGTYGLDTRTSMQAISSFSPNPFALINSSPDVSLVVDPNPICSNEITTLTASSNGANFSEYDFYVDTFLVQSGPSNTFVLANPRTGFVPIWVAGTFPECGDISDTVNLEVLAGVIANVYSDTVIVSGTTANLLATGGDFYNWLPDTALSCNICAATTASPMQTTTYTVEVENFDGCKDTLSVLVDVRQNINNVVFIPNVLTPNNDGYNDTWFIKNIQLFPKNDVKIVSRWGDVVFQTSDYQNDWDGTYGGGLLPPGTYYYILDVGGSWGILKGDVTIIRE